MDWRGFELHPETPKGGVDLEKIHQGSTSQGMLNYMQVFAKSFGVTDMRRSKWMPNTRRALAVAEYARDHDKLNEFRELAMSAHWKEGRNIEDSDVLRDLAAAAGLDPVKAVHAADDPIYHKRLDDIRREFKVVGTGGIPTFVFGKETVEGCQPYEVLERVATRAGVTKRQSS